jgi:hypothetical protein
VVSELKKREHRREKPFLEEETKCTLATRQFEIAKTPLGRNRWFLAFFV